jgi:hypothetical protein
VEDTFQIDLLSNADQLALNDSTQYAAALAAAEEITVLVSRYKHVEAIYLDVVQKVAPFCGVALLD